MAIIKNPITLVGGGNSNMIEGDYTPTSDERTITIAHNKGKDFDYASILVDDINNLPNYSTIMASKDNNTTGLPTLDYGITDRIYKSNTGAVTKSQGTTDRQVKSTADNNGVVFSGPTDSYFFRSGFTCHYKIYFD